MLDRNKRGDGQEEGDELSERQRVLIHASSLNRSDIIKKVVSAGGNPQGPSAGKALGAADDSVAPSSRTGGDEGVDIKVLNHVDGKGLTALHYAVKKSSLDAIRVLLRLGVDVTARGGAKSSFPNMTALEVAISGKCDGNPKEIKQIFLTEAVQAIAAGDGERLREFLEAGLEASSEYGVDGGNGAGGSMSLAGWADQLGQADMLATLSSESERKGDGIPADGIEEEMLPSEGTGEEQDSRCETEEEEEGRVTGPRGGGGGHLGKDGKGGEDPDDAEMFVEELRAAIVDLTAESEELEAELSRRGTLGIIKRARSTRQDLILARSEVDTANALCDKWRAEENVAAQENARLQAEVVEAQLAVQRHRAGSVGNAVEEPKPASSSSTAHRRQGGVSTTGVAAAASTVGPKATRVESASPQTSPSPPLENEVRSSFAVSEASGADGSSDGDRGAVGVCNAMGGALETNVESTKTEEAEALASQLQIIAMHLEDEVRMMRSLIDGEGAVGVMRRIRAIREEIEAIEGEARETYAISRYLEARVIVLADAGDELFSQLETLNSYLSTPPRREEEGPGVSGDARSRTAANKEDIDDDAAAAASFERSYHQGQEQSASSLGGEDEDRDDTVGGHGGVAGEVQGSLLHAANIGRDSEPVRDATTAAAPAAATGGEAGPSVGNGDEHDEGRLWGDQPTGETEGDNNGGRDVNGSSRSDALRAVREGAAEREISDSKTASTVSDARDDRAAGHEQEEEKEAHTRLGSRLGPGSDADGAEGGGQREWRARALLNAPGVDAATGVSGWKRRNRGGNAGDGSGGGGHGASAKKVTVVQDVLSVLFGWEVSSDAEKKAARGGCGDVTKAGSGGGSGGGAGVMFA